LKWKLYVSTIIPVGVGKVSIHPVSFVEGKVFGSPFLKGVRGISLRTFFNNKLGYTFHAS